MERRKRLGVADDVQVGDVWRMQPRGRMNPEAALAYAFTSPTMLVPPGTRVQVMALSAQRVHVRQLHDGQLYGPSLDYVEYLFRAWFTKVK